MGKVFYGKIDQYRKQGEIGHGGYSRVYEVVGKRSKKRYALKLFNWRDISYFDSQADLDEHLLYIKTVFDHERKMHEICSNGQFVVKMVDYSIKDMFIVLELLHPVDNIFSSYNSQPPALFNILFYNMLVDLFYVHQRGVAHNDIKENNFLYENNRNLYLLSDFSISCNTRCKVIGSTFYMAPEVMDNYDTKQNVPFMQSADIWSLGVTMYRVATGGFPFTVDCIQKWDKVNYVNKGKKLFLSHKFKLEQADVSIKLPPELSYLETLFQGMLRVNPSERTLLPASIEWIHERIAPMLNPTSAEEPEKYNLAYSLSFKSPSSSLKSNKSTHKSSKTTRKSSKTTRSKLKSKSPQRSPRRTNRSPSRKSTSPRKSLRNSN